MKVRKELFKSKTLTNGEHPIAIRIHHKKAKLVMTGVSTKAEYWNKEKLAVKCQDKKYKEKNKIVNDEYLRILQRVTEFDTINRPYDLDLLASHEEITAIYNEIDDNDTIPIYTNFFDLLDAKIQTYEEGSARKYRQLKNALIKIYGNEIAIKSINKTWFATLEENLKDKGVKQAKELIKRFITTYNWGFTEGHILSYKPISYNKRAYTSIIEKRTLDLEGFTFLQHLYSIGTNEHLNNRLNEPYTFNNNSYFNAINIFLIMVAFDGLAPIDLSHLRMKDLKRKQYKKMPLDYTRIKDSQYMKEYNNKNQIIEYYSVQLLRQKTKREVNIKLPCYIIDSLLYPYYYDEVGFKKKEDDFILNVFDKKTYSQLSKKQIYSRMSNYWNTLADALNDYIATIHNAPTSLTEKRITYYAARHTALNVLNDKGATLEEIANMAGHDLKTLEKSYLGDFNIKRKVESNLRIWENEPIQEETIESSWENEPRQEETIEGSWENQP